MSVHQAAQRLGLAPRRLRAAVRDGALPGFRPGERTVYVRWPDLLRWLGTQRVPSSNHARERAAEIISEESKKETAAG
jgi:excisionase family DNA binding protein